MANSMINSDRLKVKVVNLTPGSTTSVPNLSRGLFGILYGKYFDQWYTCTFDVSSLSTDAHQFFISSSAYVNFSGNLENETITTWDMHGFNIVSLALYYY